MLDRDNILELIRLCILNTLALRKLILVGVKEINAQNPL